MPGPTATTRLRAEQQEYASNDEAWGAHLNDGVFAIFDEAIAGVTSVAVNANVTLTVENFITDQARQAALIFTGAGGFIVTAPAVTKTYLIMNTCAADVTLKPQGGTGSIIRAGTRAVWITTGTIGYTFDPTLDQIKAAVAPISGFPGVANSDLATVGQIGPFADSAEASAIAAALSADQAEDAENGAEAYFADFVNRYLGPLTADPTVDELGNPVTTGALYFNTTPTAAMRVYNGASWLVINSVTIASQAEAEAGVVNTTVMTPLRTKQAILAQVATPGLVLLSTQTVSTAVASIDFTTGLTSTYDEYEFHFRNVRPATDSVLLAMRTSTNAGSSYDAGASDYTYILIRANSSGASTSVNNSTASTSITISGSEGMSNTLYGFSGVVRITRPSVAQSAQVYWTGMYPVTTTFNITTISGVGTRVAAADVDAIRFMFNSGNIAAGAIAMYGIRKT